DYPVEQLARDCKIASIFEGTDGIQAMDLLGRKLGLKNGEVFAAFMAEMRKTIDAARSIDAIEPLAKAMAAAADQLNDTALALGRQAAGPEFKTAYAAAHPFMMAMGDVILGWMLLWRALAAAPELQKRVDGLDGGKRTLKIENDKQAAYYDGQIQTARYYIGAVLPEALGRLAAVRDMGDAVLRISERGFGG
ncbi:MAG TPA: acyl-CoA dehydrogenase, partial [Desulfosarcina sp.]|nr:acyl-CoA dehydrogenase [Desulfosarcina sp.]